MFADERQFLHVNCKKISALTRKHTPHGFLVQSTNVGVLIVWNEDLAYISSTGKKKWTSR